MCRGEDRKREECSRTNFAKEIDEERLRIQRKQKEKKRRKKKKKKKQTIGESIGPGMRCVVMPRMSKNENVDDGTCEIIPMIGERAWPRRTTDRTRWISVVGNA